MIDFMIKLNHTCHDISLWDLSQPNTEGFWSKMSHFPGKLGSLGLVGERLSSPSPVRARAQARLLQPLVSSVCTTSPQMA